MAAIQSLQTFPQRCAYATENERFPFEVRQLLFGRKPNVYRVLFTIEDVLFSCCASVAPDKR